MAGRLARHAALESRHLKDAALSVAKIVVGGVVSVASAEAAMPFRLVVQRLAVDGEAPDRDNRAALHHANDRKSRGFPQHSGHCEGVGGLGADDRQAADDQTLATGLRPFEL